MPAAPPTPSPSPALLQAALDLSRCAIDNDSDILPQQEHLHHICTLHPSLTSSLDSLHLRLLHEDPHPHIPHFRRTRHLLRPLLPPHLPPSLLHLAADLLVAVATSSVAAVRLSLIHPTPPPVLVLPAHAPAPANAHALAAFLAAVRALPAAPPTAHLTLALALCPAPSADRALFHRVRHRIALRLLDLSPEHLGLAPAHPVHPALRLDARPYPHPARFPASDVAPPPNPAPSFHIRLDARLASDRRAAHLAAALLARRATAALSHVLHAAVAANFSTLRVLLLSHASWAPLPEGGTPVTYHADRIRTYLNAYGVRTLEIRVDGFGDWDRAVLDGVLMQGLSASVLVFRFADLEGLARVIASSKHVTDCFPALTADPRRVLYVETTSSRACAQTIRRVQEAAVERRLAEPSAQKDIFFEAAEAEWAYADISERAMGKKCVVHAGVCGPGRACVEKMVGILNREISVEEAREETRECIEFLLRLRSTLSTKVSVQKEARCISVRRADATGFGMMGSKMGKLMREREYRDFRDVTCAEPFTVDVRVVLGERGQAAVDEMGRWTRKWGALSRLGGKADSPDEVFLAVATERKTVLEKGKERFVTGVNVTVLGGEMEEYLHAKLIRACLEAVEAEKEEETQLAARTLLGLVPGLDALVKGVE